MAVLWAVPAWGVPGDAGEDLDAQHHEERYGIANVLDYGAACDLQANNGTASVTDDATAINAAILAVFNSVTISSLYFPRPCYTTGQITWKRTVNLIGPDTSGDSGILNQAVGGGIFCAEGMDDDCVVSDGNGFHWARAENFTITKARFCTENTDRPCYTNASGCTCNGATTDTVGSGLVFNTYLGEGFKIDNIWVERFPEYGIEVNQGTTGTASLEGLSLWGNGQAAPVARTAAAGATTTTIVATVATYTIDKYIDWYVRVLTGTGAGQTRLITDNDTDTLTVTPTWTTTPAAADTFEIDNGGGILLKTGAIDLDGCHIDTISGDGNAPALIVVAEGSGGEHTGGGPACVITNVKSEVTGTSYPQENGLRLINSGIHILLQGLVHSDVSPFGFPAIYFEGKNAPRELTYSGVGIAQNARSDYVTLSTMGVDAAAALQIEIGGSATGAWSHEGSIPNNIIVHPRTTPPFTCGSTHWRANKYYDTDLEYECICNGSAWKPVSDPAGTTCT